METKLLIYLLLFLSTTCFDNIFNARWLDTMQNYTIFAGGILFPLSGVFFFSIPMFYLKYKGKISNSNSIDIVSKKDLIIIALFDSLNSILQSIPTPYLSVVSMTVFNRLSLVGIPIVSRIFLDTKYFPNHYLGIFLTLYGISLTFIPEILNHKEIGNWWLCIYILGIFPAIASFIYKEKKLKNNPDIWWFNTWVCFYQFFIGIMLLPFNILITSAQDKNASFKNFGKQIGNGFVCQFAGKNMQKNDNCQYAFFWFLIFNILTTIMNSLMLIIIRDGSSVVFVLTNTLKTPITAFLGSFKSLAGKNTAQLNITHLYSFILLILSSVVYNWKSEIKQSNINYNFEEYEGLDYKKLKDEEKNKPIDIILNPTST